MKNLNSYPELKDGDLLVVVKQGSKFYANKFKFKDNKLGNKLKSRIEATQRILLGENFINR